MARRSPDEIAQAIKHALETVAADNLGGGPVNLADAIYHLADMDRRIAEAIIPYVAAPGTDASGSDVSSLTEAVMGMTAGLCNIAEAVTTLAQCDHSDKVAEAINNLADAIRERNEIAAVVPEPEPTKRTRRKS